MMKNIISSYVTALDELNLLVSASYHTADHAAQVADDLLSGLIHAYTLGVQNASAMLGTNLPVNLDEMEEAIYVLIDGKTFADRVATHMQENSLGRLQTLAQSEFHRVYNRAVDDSAKTYIRQGNAGITKTWCTAGDEKVRDTHDYLEGMTINASQDFYTYDGDYAAYPGGFSKPENNINCRCIVILHGSEPVKTQPQTRG